MAWTRALPPSSICPKSRPPLFIEKASAPLMYCWKTLAACLSNDTDAQCGDSCLQSTAIAFKLEYARYVENK